MGAPLWRLFFLLGGLFIILGGPQHPGGTMAEMLAHPDWLLSHSLLLTGFSSLLIGLVLYRGAGALPERTRRWGNWAIIGAALQTVEMGFHTAAYVDRENLVAGAATPVLTAHLWLTAIFYPVFAFTIMGLIVAGARDRALGSPWIAWIGILGAAAHGMAGLFGAGFRLRQFAVLFPGVVLLALWLVLAALWPIRATGTRT
jgi:hypothetical protein